MNKPHKSFSINECKIQASILLKSLRANDPKAFKRLKRLPDISNLSAPEIKRKHALLVIALEKGFKSWEQLKCQLPFIRGGFLNQWFANYAEAKAFLQSNGGYLLPFKNQFFICDADYISQLGFNPIDPDWKLIGFDWEKPSNQDAWKRLYKKWMAIQEKQS